MALGGDGVISVFSNPYPKERKQITDALLSNNIDKARKHNNKYLKMMNLLFIETSPAPVKFVMYKKGLCKNIFRLPMEPVNRKSEVLLLEEMKNI
jgi:4-hydroxy-tetrahydrodipicolinate synthase